MTGNGGKKPTQFVSSGVPSVQSSWYWIEPHGCLQDYYEKGGFPGSDS